MTDRSASSFAGLAALVHRLSVLLAAGLAPDSAWRHLASSAEEGADQHLALDVRAVMDGIAKGMDAGSAILDAVTASPPAAPPAAPPALPRPRPRRRRERARRAETGVAWRALAAAWVVATRSGAPLAPTLARFADVLRALAQAEREVETALAGPAASARIVVALPVVGLLFGAALGFDVIGTLFTTVPGVVCLLVGAALLALSAAWTRRLVSTARRRDPTPGLALELVAIAAGGGGALGAARERADEVLATHGLGAVGADVDDVIRFATSAGVPAAALLRAEAEEARRAATAEGARRAASLGVRLMLPLGVCVLPAFLAWGVVPTILALVASTADVL